MNTCEKNFNLTFDKKWFYPMLVDQLVKASPDDERAITLVGYQLERFYNGNMEKITVAVKHIEDMLQERRNQEITN